MFSRILDFAATPLASYSRVAVSLKPRFYQSLQRRASCGKFCAGGSVALQIFHGTVVLLDSDAFRLGLLGEVDDALGVLGVDRIVPIAVRVLVSW